MTIPLEDDIARAWLAHMDTGKPLVGPVKALADAIRAHLPAEVAEPPHDAIVVDRKGCPWMPNTTLPGTWLWGSLMLSWDYLAEEAGPLKVYLPQRDMVAREGHGLYTLTSATKNRAWRATCECVGSIVNEIPGHGFRAYADTEAEAIRAVEIHAAGGMQ